MIKNALRFALGIFRGKTIYNFVFVALCGVLQTHFMIQKSTTHFCVVLFVLVEITGIEPVTSCMPCKRSPS